MEITLSQQYNIREKPTVIHYVKLQKQGRNYIINQLPSLVFKITTTIIYQYFILPVGFDAACNFSFPLPLTTLLYHLVYGVFFLCSTGGSAMVSRFAFKINNVHV